VIKKENTLAYIIILIGMFLCPSLPSAGVPNNAKCIKGNCVNGEGTYTEFFEGTDLEVKLTYTGQFKNGKAHVQGTVSYIITINTSGSKMVSEWKYVGQFKDGKADGQGTVSGDCLNGPAGIRGIGNYFKYIGNFKDGKAHGQGNLSIMTSVSYFPCKNFVGTFENGFYKGAVSSECSSIKQFPLEINKIPSDASSEHSVDLNGIWKSGKWNGPDHTIEIKQTGENAVATSIYPGVNIGSVFWKWNVRTGKGEYQLFRLPRVVNGPYNGPYLGWEPCTVQVHDTDNITIWNIPYTRSKSQHQSELNPYKPTISKEYGWGNKPKDFGLRDQEELEILGPHTFALDRSGNMYVVDSINGHIKTFGNTKEFESNDNFSGWGADIIIGDSGEILTSERDSISVSSSGGTTRYEISKEIPDIEGYGQGMQFDDAGNLYNCKFQQCYQIGKKIDGKLRILDSKEQTETVIPGYPLKGSKCIRTLWKNNHEAVIEIMDEDWTVIKEIPMKTEDVFGAVVFRRQDEAEFLYIEIERITKDDYVHLEVWKYDETGRLLSVTELPNDYYSTIYKKFEIDSKGTVHQILTTPEGVKLMKWEPDSK